MERDLRAAVAAYAGMACGMLAGSVLACLLMIWLFDVATCGGGLLYCMLTATLGGAPCLTP